MALQPALVLPPLWETPTVTHPGLIFHPVGVVLIPKALAWFNKQRSFFQFPLSNPCRGPSVPSGLGTSTDRQSLQGALLGVGGGGGQVPSINVSSLPAWKGPSLALWGTRGRREPLPLGKWLPVPGSVSFPPQTAPASLSAAPGLPHSLPRGQGQVHPRWASNLIRPQTQAVGRSFLESGISPLPNLPIWMLAAE